MNIERAMRWCWWGVLLVQSLCLGAGWWAWYDGAGDSAMTLGALGLAVSAMMFGGGTGRRRTRRMVE